MRVSIADIRPASATEWDEIWDACDYATYFHSREWAEIWNVYTEGKMYPDPKLIVFNDGKEALLPLSCQKGLKGLAKNYISSPAGTYGGWISTDDMDADHAAPVVEFLTKKLGNILWRINPHDESIRKIGLQIGAYDETQVLRLEEGFEEIYKTWTNGHRSAANKASGAGVLVRPATALEEWKMYYQVYEDSLRRWKDRATSRYHWTIFQEMFRRKSSNIRLWLAIFQGKVIAGAINFHAKRHIAGWHLATLEEHFSLRPANLLMREVIKNACEQKYSVFDFNPSGGHEGVKKFKSGFGAETLPCPVVRVEAKPARFLKKINKIKKNIIEAIKIYRPGGA